MKTNSSRHRIGDALLNCLVFSVSYTISFLFCLVGAACILPATEGPMADAEALFILIVPVIISAFITSKCSRKRKEKRTMAELIAKANATDPVYTAPVRSYSSPEPEHPYRSDAEDQLSRIDFMEGHDFEYWCAALLRKIGFCNVEVTQGSGDQGVDVLAEKDGIRYAIQCKCYSKDLGNSPVQEVSAGRMMPQYRCQVGAVMTNRYFTKGAQDLATATGTLLWDRDWILQQLQSTGQAAPTSSRPNQLLTDIMEDFFHYDDVSVSRIQHRFGLDHDRAAFIMKTLEEHGFIVQPKRGCAGYVKISYEMWQKVKDRPGTPTPKR